MKVVSFFFDNDRVHENINIFIYISWHLSFLPPASVSPAIVINWHNFSTIKSSFKGSDDILFIFIIRQASPISKSFQV